MTGMENRFLEGIYTLFLADVVAAMSTQATPSNDVAASSRRRKGAGDGRQGKAKIIRVISSVVSFNSLLKGFVCVDTGGHYGTRRREGCYKR